MCSVILFSFANTKTEMQKKKTQIVISTNYVFFKRTLICAVLLFFNFAFSTQFVNDSAFVNKTERTNSLQTVIFISEGTSVYGLYEGENELSESQSLTSQAAIYISDGAFLYAQEDYVKGHIIKSESTEIKLSILKADKKSRNLKRDKPEVKKIVQKNIDLQLVYKTSGDHYQFSLYNTTKNTGFFSNLSSLKSKKFIQNTTEYKAQCNFRENLGITFYCPISDDDLSFSDSYFTRPPPFLS